MTGRNVTRTFATVAALLLFAVGSHAPASAQDRPGKSGKKKQAPTGTPVLWRDPVDVSARDLLLGPGGESMKPDLGSVTFIEQEFGGYSPKLRVRDGAGRVWVAKLGKESQPETASSRLVWAVGYVTEIPYLVPCVHIKGAPATMGKVERCEGRGFANVRFEARPRNVRRLAEWGWTNNPFAGTRELKGLIVLMALLNNWDLKDANNKIIYVPAAGGGRGELQYIVSDLGATFGKTGNFVTRNRNSPGDYARSKFVERVEGRNVVFGYDGKDKGLMRGITVGDARWIGGLLSKLTDQQLRDAFRAANYGPEDVRLLSGAVRSRINELSDIGGGAPAAATPD